MTDPNGNTNYLTEEDRQVFDLLAATRRQCAAYLEVVEPNDRSEFRDPYADNYRWDKPMTFVFSR